MNYRYLTIFRSPNRELFELLNQNVIGTPGVSMLYQHQQVEEKLKGIADPYFVNVIRAGKIAGTCCFCSRITLNQGQSIRSFYIRYFSFKDSFRRNSLRIKTVRGNNGLRKEIETMLNGDGLNCKPDKKFFHYAYVDLRNERSALLCNEFGFESVRQFTAVVFSRLFPKISRYKILEVKAETVHDLLTGFYHTCNTFSVENLSNRTYTFIEDEHGQRVAGVLTSPDRWKIHAITGWMSTLMLNIFSRLPIMNKLLNKNFHFLSVDGMYVLPGYEKYFENLLESLLAKHKLHTAIVMVDANSTMYTMLQSLRLGLLNKIRKETRGNVIAKFVNFTEAEKEKFRNHPVYISGIDAA